MNIVQPDRDFGDGPTETTLGQGGAVHQYDLDHGLRLGTVWDAEPNGVTSSDANYDDTHGADDEDGLVQYTDSRGQLQNVSSTTSFVQGEFVQLSINLSDIPGATGDLERVYLNAWLDFVNPGFTFGDSFTDSSLTGSALDISEHLKIGSSRQNVLDKLTTDASAAYEVDVSGLTGDTLQTTRLDVWVYVPYGILPNATDAELPATLRLRVSHDPNLEFQPDS